MKYEAIYIVDAFTAVPGAGNPAAVCVTETWPDDAAMQALAKKNGLSETAFLVKEGEGYRLRWFTPENEEVLCGSAHCQIAVYWAEVLEKPRIEAYQASVRGGTLYCMLLGGGRIHISGEAALERIEELPAAIFQ